VRAGGGMSRLSRPAAAPEEAVLAAPGDADLAGQFPLASCKYRNLAEPGPERQNGRVYSAGFFEDRWRRYPHPSISRGFGSSRS
jgi:hypothetical protein